MLPDLRYAIRLLAKSPGFTTVAVLTLALGIGANSAIFSVVNAVLLESPQYKNPGQLVWIWATRKTVSRAFYSIQNFSDTRAQSQTLQDWTAFSTWGVNLRGDQETERLQGIRISTGGLQNLGVQPAAGRSLTADDDKADAPRTVMLSHGLWQRRFGRDPNIIGTSQTLNGDSYTIVGILPRQFMIPNAETEIVGALRLETDPRRGERGTNFLRLMARLRDHVTPQQAQLELAAITARLSDEFPDDNGNLTAPRVLLVQNEIVGGYRQILLVVLGAVGVVLLIACSNLANLQLARASARHREMSIRSALGATRWRLIRQLLAEGVVLATIGGAAGLLIAIWGKDILIAMAPADFPRATAITMDGRVLLFCASISVLAGLVLGLVPAVRTARSDLSIDLKDGRSATGAGVRSRARNALMVAEISLSLVLLICAGLLIKSFTRLQNVNPGFSAQRAVAVRLSLPPAKFLTGAAVKSFYEELASRLTVLPGVESVGAASALPLSALNARTEFVISGRPPAKPSDVPGAQHRWVSPGYFHAMKIPLRRGREFTAQDDETGAGVVVIDQALAQRFFAGEDPLGAHIQISLGDGSVSRNYEIVGIAKSVKHNSLSEESAPTFYGPMAQTPKGVVPFLANNFSLIVRTDIDPQAMFETVRRELRTLDPDVAVSSVRSMEEVLSGSVAPQEFNLMLVATFAGTALLLAAGGIYGVIAYLVTERTREIGVRLALGAQRSDVLRLIIGHALKIVLAGVGLGLAGALAATRSISALLFSTSVTDPLTYACITTLLIIVALLASYLPARRAMKIDPMVALRYE